MVPQSSWAWRVETRRNISRTEAAKRTFNREKKIFTSVQRGGVVNVCSYEGRFSLSANSVIPHPPDTTLKEIFHQGQNWHTERERERHVRYRYSTAMNLSVSCSSPTLAAGVAAVGSQGSALHRIRRTGRGGDAALREAQASAIVLLTLHTQRFNACVSSQTMRSHRFLYMQWLRYGPSWQGCSAGWWWEGPALCWGRRRGKPGGETEQSGTSGPRTRWRSPGRAASGSPPPTLWRDARFSRTQDKSVILTNNFIPWVCSP